MFLKKIIGSLCVD